jgi:hypothetical protein
MSISPLRSPIKYPGGKRKLIPEILQRLPTDLSLLCEPFFGGGSLGLQLAGEGKLRRLVAGEACEPVRALWEALHNGLLHAVPPGGEIHAQLRLSEDHGLLDFSRQRDRFNRLIKSDQLAKHADLRAKLGTLFFPPQQDLQQRHRSL